VQLGLFRQLEKIDAVQINRALHKSIVCYTHSRLRRAAPSLPLDLPLGALLRQREGEDTKPTGTLALEREGEIRGQNDVGVRVDDIGANDPIVCDALVGDSEIVRPFLCLGEPTALSIWTCRAIRSHTINDDNIGAESTAVSRDVFAIEAAQRLCRSGL
jgi:hypothetical protein